jgi:hypothetical protein
VVSRRALLLGGGAALLAAGCGKDEVVGPPPATQVMLRELGAERALAADLQGVDGLRGRIGDRAGARADKLASAIAARGGNPHDAPEGTGSAADAPEHAQAALEAHVAALPSLTGDLRAMGVDFVAESAADAALLGAAGGAFPGTPA